MSAQYAAQSGSAFIAPGISASDFIRAHGRFNAPVRAGGGGLVAGIFIAAIFTVVALLAVLLLGDRESTYPVDALAGVEITAIADPAQPAGVSLVTVAPSVSANP